MGFHGAQAQMSVVVAGDFRQWNGRDSGLYEYSSERATCEAVYVKEGRRKEGCCRHNADYEFRVDSHCAVQAYIVGLLGCFWVVSCHVRCEWVFFCIDWFRRYEVKSVSIFFFFCVIVCAASVAPYMSDLWVIVSTA
jgi:hypothetical protein